MRPLGRSRRLGPTAPLCAVAWLGLAGCSAEHVVGSLGFGEPARYPASDISQAVVADFDGDGTADLVTQGRDGVTLCIRAGLGDGSLASSRCQTLTDAATAIAALPTPGGPAQLLRASGGLATWRLSGGGMFVGTGSTALAGSAVSDGLFPSDLDGDGRSDVLVAESGPNQIEAVLSTMSGLRSAGRYPLSLSPKTLLYRDLDGDYHPELAVLSADSLDLWGERGVAHWSGCPSPRFSQPIALWPVSRWLRLETALMVVDAATGLLGVVRALPQAEVVYECGGVVLLPGVVGSRASSWVAAAADVDGDGAQELVLAQPSGHLDVFAAQDGEIGRLTGTSLPSPVSRLVVGDLNHDDLPEVLAISTRGDEVLVLVNLFRRK